MPSVASQVSASINQHRDAKASASANGKERASSSPFEEMLDSAVAAEDPTPSAKTKSPAKAANANAASQGKNTKSADDAAARDDAAPAQPDNIAKDDTALGETAERNDAKLADLVGKALLTGAGDDAPPLQPELVEDAAPLEKPIVEIGLAAFREAVASAIMPQPQAEPAKDEPQTAEADANAGADPLIPAAGPVKADAVAAAVMTMAAEAPADPVQSGVAGSKTVAAIGASPAPADTAASDQQIEGALKLGEQFAAGAEAPDAEGSPAPKPDAPKPHAHRVETTTQPGDAAKLKLQGSGAAEGEPAAGKAEAPAPHRSPAAPRAETTEAKPAKAGVTAGDTPAPAKPVDAPQMLQTLLPSAAPTVAPIQALSAHKDVGPVAAAVPIEGVAVEIAARASDGVNTFEIRLDPPELGRIHVRLDVDRNGELTSRVVADRQDTLDLLRRDAPQLERALNDAGLRTSNNGLQFSLRDQGQGQHQQHQALPQAARLIIPDEHLAAELVQRGYYQPAGSAGGIDIRV